MPEGSPLAFPCDFPIKVMGRKHPGFAQTVMEIVLKHAPDFDPASKNPPKIASPFSTNQAIPLSSQRTP